MKRNTVAREEKINEFCISSNDKSQIYDAKSNTDHNEITRKVEVSRILLLGMTNLKRINLLAINYKVSYWEFGGSEERGTNSELILCSCPPWSGVLTHLNVPAIEK